ncbi:hypothetical protein GIB67_018889 [Kingdonia uniflora]|uniref:Aminotransferase-like plant mobile domain-containing protein n=1 Tax=Kingdonia uniflora TaxID=39325 RepID=A0A7J7MYT0_9MAGN|nr:hypothetical protein GIB67_018889 [Kingdonia uniflora]
MQMPEGDPHPSTLHGFRGTRDLERSVTRLRSGRKKKWVEFEDVQPQDIPNPTEDNFPRRCITQLPDGVSYIYYTGKELTNRDSMRVHDTFTTVFKVWKHIATLPAVRDAVVNILGKFMDIRLGNSDNRLIQALTERWWPTTHTFMFPCAEIGVTPLDFTMLTSLSIDRYPTQVPYDDTWFILSNARQLFPNIDSSHIKSENASIAHLRTYLTVEANREDDITIARAFILFMMGYLWFHTANDTYWFYEYCGVGHPIVKEKVTGEVRIPLDPPLSMSPHISPAALHEMRQAEFVDCEQFVIGEERETYASYWTKQTLKVGHMLKDSQRTGNLDLFGPSALRAGIIPMVVMSASVHSLSQDFSLPGEAEGPDLGWHMEWTGRRERLPTARLTDPPPMSSSYGAEEL